MIKLPLPDDTATDIETLMMLFELASYLQPEVIAEAGTWKGHFSTRVADLLPYSQVFTADTIDNKVEGPENFVFFHGDFENMLQQWFKPNTIDFAFIDSGPPFADEWEHTVRWRHYSAVKPYMVPGGLVISHDMNSRDWQHAEDILAESSLYLPGGRGITIWQKPL